MMGTSHKFLNNSKQIMNKLQKNKTILFIFKNVIPTSKLSRFLNFFLTNQNAN